LAIDLAPGRQRKLHAPLPPLAAPVVHVYTIEACVCGTINFNICIFLSLQAIVGKVSHVEKGTTVVWLCSPLAIPMDSISIATQGGKGGTIST